MGESVVDQLDGPAREKEEEKIAGHRPGLWLSSVVIRVLLLLSLPDLGGSSSTTNRLPNFHATEVIALVRGVAELPCDVTTPDPEDPVRLVLWYRSDSSTPIYSVDTRDSDFGVAEQWSGGEILGQRATFRADRHPAALILTNVKAKDEASYRCRVDFRLAQTRNAHVNLTVIVPPRRPIIVAKEGQLTTSSTLAPMTAGQALSLSCETSGGKPLPRLVWLRDGRVIDDSFVTTFENTVRNDLWLPSLDRSDLDATLTCEASNSNLTMPVSTSVTIDLHMPPLSVQLLGADQPLSAGKEVTLTCLVLGSRPPPVLTWQLDDRVLSEMSAQPTPTAGWNETKGVIRFTPMVEDRGKRLSCRAKNVNISRVTETGVVVLEPPAGQHHSAGYFPEHYKEDAKHLVVYARPDVQLTLGSNLMAANIKEGDDVYFDCRASALPPVTRLEWFHNEKKLSHNISVGIITTNQSLVLQRVSRHSAGRYRCSATNREGETESDVFHLNVKYAPFCRPGQHRVYGVARHEEARISCDLDANPSGSLHFRWLFNSSAGVIELPASTWTAEGSRSVARYLPSSDLDFGSLLCSASNSIGQQAVPCLYHVIPADKPDPVSNCSVSHQSSESLQIACSEGFSGGLPQNFLLEIFTADGALAGSAPAPQQETSSQRPYLPAELKTFNQTSMKPVFIVRGLDADTTYVGQVTAVNAKGRSESFVVRVVTLRPPETQKNVGPGKSEVDPPRPQPSSSSQISPLVAIITGVISALFLLASLLVVALRLQCRRAQMRAASAAAVVMSASSGALSSGHRGSVVGGASGGGSETLLLVKSEQLHSTTTPLFSNSTDSDDRNPDLIPHRDDGDRLQPTAVMLTTTAAGGGPPLAAMLTDLPPHFCTRQLGVTMMGQGSSATLGRGKTRWRGEQDEFVSQSLVHVSSTLPRPPRPPWTNSSNHHVGSSVQRFNVTAPPSSASSAAAAAALAASKKESSV
ncbi:nephrin-like isoform X1 [Daphnia pulex]|uniref:nephrin-like isoform X1 n=2 Tax=Daphnia pulex TaxID=6669 RepID=UPI001EDD666A|nr:nephrin-like isoform X1 [Daphnia pulex]